MKLLQVETASEMIRCLREEGVHENIIRMLVMTNVQKEVNDLLKETHDPLRHIPNLRVSSAYAEAALST